MKTPRFNILPNGTKVEFKTTYEGEEVVLEGVVCGNGADKCMYRSLRDLVYYIKEDSTSIEYETVHHEDVQEIIECECCESDLLESGIDEDVCLTRTYDKHWKKEKKECFSELESDREFACSYCKSTVSKENLKRLKSYLDI